ncbi:uncharacterized protein LODBEIA_P32360 [Lodderomyces beijingensis]|uniref:Nucleoporin Nup159/Nup146 N-terminal domain-containing protein n=1 Tax=Lodderomyces beijingensis TaxID=1775926 RepID=A0ABP0ZLI5_9ASCO
MSSIIEEEVSEDIGFKLDPTEHKLYDQLELSSPELEGKTLNLLAINNQLRVLATSNYKTLQFTSLDNFSDINRVPADFKITELYFIDSVLYILNDQTIQTLTISQIQNKDYAFKKIERKFQTILPLNRSQYLGLTEDSSLYHNEKQLATGVTAFAWKDHKPIYAVKDAPLKLMCTGNGIDNGINVEIEEPESIEGYEIVSIIPEGDYILLAYDQSDAEEFHDIKTFLLKQSEEEKKNDTYKAFIIDIAPAFGSAPRVPTFYTSAIKNWIQSNYFSIVTSSLSTDIGVLDLNSSLEEAQTIAPAEDSNRAQFPMSDEGEDISPLGMCISLNEVETKVDEPCLGVEEAVGVLPKLYCLLDNGALRSWWIFHKSGILENKLSLKNALEAFEKEEKTLQGYGVTNTTDSVEKKEEKEEEKIATKEAPTLEKNPFQTASNPFGSSTSDAFKFATKNDAPANAAPDFGGFGSSNIQTKPAAAFGSTSFGSNSQAKPAFGSTGFGSKTASTGGGFGQSGFGAGATSTAGGFGSSSFGSSGFGSSGFGSSGFGNTGFGGQQQQQKQDQGVSGKESSLSSGFAKFGNGKNTASFGSAQGQSIFDAKPNTTSPSPSSSPFANLESSKSGSLFATSSTKTNENKSSSPFANLGSSSTGVKADQPSIFASSTNKTSSPFANLDTTTTSTKAKAKTEPQSTFGGNLSPFSFEKPADAPKPRTESPFDFLKKDKAKVSDQAMTKATPIAESVESLRASSPAPKAVPKATAPAAFPENSPSAKSHDLQSQSLDKALGSKSSLEQEEKKNLSAPAVSAPAMDKKSKEKVENSQQKSTSVPPQKAIEKETVSKGDDAKANKTNGPTPTEEEEEEDDGNIAGKNSKEGNDKIDSSVQPLEFAVYDGINKTKDKPSKSIRDTIIDIVEDTEGNLQVLDKNMQSLARFVDAHGSPGQSWHTVSEVANLKYSQYNYAGKLSHLKEQLTKLEELKAAVQESQAGRIKLDQMFTQLVLLEKGALKNLSVLKNRPLEIKDELMQRKLREKLAKTRELEDKLLAVLMPVKARNSLNASTVANIGKVLYQLSEQIAEKKKSVDELVAKFDALQVEKANSDDENRVILGKTTPIKSAKLDLRRKLRQSGFTKSITLSKIA